MTRNQVIAAGVLGGVVVTAMLGSLGLRQRLSPQEDLDHQIALAKKEGIWLDSYTELSPKPKPDENAAPLYEKASKLVTNTPEYQHLRSVNLDDAEDRKIVAAYLAKNAPALALAEKASQKPYCVFPEEQYMGLGVPTPQFSKFAIVRTFVKAFGYRANLEAREGRLEAAAGDLTSAARIASHLGQSPQAIAVAVRGSFDATICRSIEQIVSFSKPFASKADAILDALGSPPDAQKVLREELAAVFATNSFAKNYVASHSPGESKPKANYDAEKRLMAGLVQGYREFFASAAKDGSVTGMRDAMQRIAEEFTKMPGERGSLVATVFPVWTDVFATFGKDAALRRAARQAVAILQSGTIPKELPLGGELAEDPSGHQPLGYLPTSSSFVIYALGKPALSQGPLPAEVPKGSFVAFSYPYHRS